MASSNGSQRRHPHFEPDPEMYDLEDLEPQETLERGESSNDFTKRLMSPSIDTYNTLAPQESDNPASSLSPSAAQRVDDSRLNDDLELLRAERLISNQEEEKNYRRGRITSHESEDAFNEPSPTQVRVKRKDTDAVLYKFLMFLKKYPRFIRYFVYLLPGAIVLLIPVLLGALRYSKGKKAVGGVGGVDLMWFGIWLEIIWCSLWVSRMATSLMPILFYGLAKIGGSTNAKKWKDIGYQLELHTALFLWMLALLISFMPVCNSHRVPVPEDKEDEVNDSWINIVWKIIISLFVLATLNFIEKILIQWIATAFHERTYATRIENNKADTNQLVHLFEYAKARLENSDSFWKGGSRQSASGTQTPMQAFHENARQVWGKVGNVANKVGNDLIGRKVTVNHPHKVVSELLRTTGSAHTLARLIYRSLVRTDRDLVLLEDLQSAFASEEEAEASFGMFDKDLNGDISMEEFEAVCNEVHLEKKAIAASLKDLDSVIQKLDKVFLFIIVIIAIIVFISIFSGSTAAALGSAGTTVLGLAWVLQATAQEFLQSIIFVFVKHPFDVGDRVTIYGSFGAAGTGDDYYVTEVSLLYTEFKKLEGHIVQAPNSILNTLFILNQRRSNGLSDPVPLVMRFGTPAHMIEELKASMLEFALQHKRDYQPRVITELSGFVEMRACNVTFVFFHKSNFQNELLRLNRHNRFVTELMTQMVRIGIQGPQRIDPGGSRDNPMYWAPPAAPPAYDKEQQHEYHGAAAEHVEGPAASGPMGGASPMLEPYKSSSYNSQRTEQTRVDNATRDQMTDFQDVFENRREQAVAQRIASIREKDRAARKEAEAEAEAEPRASTSALEPTFSFETGSQRSRLFGRPRSKSRVKPVGEFV